MAEDDLFNIRWNNFQTTVMSAFDSLLLEETLVDVTLASEGKWLKAHRLVLSAYSDYFKELLTVQPEKHAIVYLRDVPFSHLEALIAFIYRGEVNISQSDLPSFIKTVTSLRIRGLTESYRHSQGLACRTAEHPTVSSLSLTNGNSERVEALPKRFLDNAYHNCSPSGRRSKRVRTDSRNHKDTPATGKNGQQETQTATDLLHNDYIVTLENCKITGSRNAPQRKPEVSLPNLTIIQPITESPVPSNQSSIVSIPATTEEETSTLDELFCNVVVPKIELEEADLGTVDLDHTTDGGKEEWRDVEEYASSEQVKGIRMHEANGTYGISDTELEENKILTQGHDASILSSSGISSGRFACSQCPRSYKHSRDLRSHKKYECRNVARQFCCTLCDYKGKRHHHLIRHMRGMHKGIA